MHTRPLNSAEPERPIMYSEQVAHHVSRVLGPFYVLLALAWLVLVPVALAAATGWSWRRRPRSNRSGFLLGLTVAAWASASWLGFPYLGAYPNIPGLLLAAVGVFAVLLVESFGYAADMIGPALQNVERGSPP